MATKKNRNFINASKGLTEEFYKAVEEIFPETITADVANAALEAVAALTEQEMKKGMAKHILTGETRNAVLPYGWERAGYKSDSMKARAFVGIPREGNVINERPHPSKFKNGRINDKEGDMGEGPFYKGVYLEHGHGSFDGTHWFYNACGKARRSMRTEIIKALKGGDE